MVFPGVAGLGEANLVIAKLASGEAVTTVSVSMLLPGLGSGVAEVTVPLLISVWPAGALGATRPVTVMETDWLTGSGFAKKHWVTIGPRVQVKPGVASGTT